MSAGRIPLLVWLAAAVALGGGGALAARAAGLSLARVASGSMAPAADRGDWILVRSLDDHARDRLRSGDVVLFSFPLGTTGRAIKRVAATGGEHVAFSGRTITVDGRTRATGGIPTPGARGALIVPPGQLFLLGDHAAVSIDSRSFGPISADDAVGRVVAILPGAITLPAALIAAMASLAGLSLALVRRPAKYRGVGQGVPTVPGAGR